MYGEVRTTKFAKYTKRGTKLLSTTFAHFVVK
jgi:hypothetical protein